MLLEQVMGRNLIISSLRFQCVASLQGRNKTENFRICWGNEVAAPDWVGVGPHFKVSVTDWCAPWGWLLKAMIKSSNTCLFWFYPSWLFWMVIVYLFLKIVLLESCFCLFVCLVAGVCGVPDWKYSLFIQAEIPPVLKWREWVFYMAEIVLHQATGLSRSAFCQFGNWSYFYVVFLQLLGQSHVQTEGIDTAQALIQRSYAIWNIFNIH